MATTMPKAGEVDRKWYVLDAAGKPLGRVAAQAAHLLLWRLYFRLLVEVLMMERLTGA